MKFEEFKSLVQERKSLLEKRDEESFLRIQEIDKNLCPKRYEMYKGLSKDVYLLVMESVLGGFFNIGKENVKIILDNYFKDNAEILDNSQNSFFVEYKVQTTTKIYSLGEGNDVLHCLFTKGKGDWDLLLQDNPGLIEHLWENFENLKRTERKEQVSLVERMIKEKNQEQVLLESPKHREEKIAQIKKEKKVLEDLLSLVKNNMDEI